MASIVALCHLASREGHVRGLLAAVTSIVAAAIAGGTVWMLKPTPPAAVQVTRLAVSLPAGDTLGT